MEQTEAMARENALKRESETVEIKARIPLPLYLRVYQKCHEAGKETSTYFSEALEAYEKTN